MSWTASKADLVALDTSGDGVSDIQVAATGSMVVSPIKTTTYLIAARGTGKNGSLTATATVTVTVAYINPIPPLVSISASNNMLIQGNSTTLSWSSQYADTVTIDNGVGSVAASGSLAVAPLNTTTYTITATGSGGTTKAEALVVVGSESLFAPVLVDKTNGSYGFSNKKFVRTSSGLMYLFVGTVSNNNTITGFIPGSEGREWVTIKVPQQNLWVTTGVGSCPSA